MGFCAQEIGIQCQQYGRRIDRCGESQREVFGELQKYECVSWLSIKRVREGENMVQIFFATVVSATSPSEIPLHQSTPPRTFTLIHIQRSTPTLCSLLHHAFHMCVIRYITVHIISRNPPNSSRSPTNPSPHRSQITITPRRQHFLVSEQRSHWRPSRLIRRLKHRKRIGPAGSQRMIS